MSLEFHREDTANGGYAEIEYFTSHGFGVFLEVGYRKENGVKEEWTMVEVPRKQARSLAKSILRATKKRK